MHNPVTGYRFLLDGGTSGYRFVNGTGVHERTVSDAMDFRLSAYAAPPAWLADSSFYQVFPDRFASSGAPRQWGPWATMSAWDDPVDTDGRRSVHQVYGGDLAGIEAHLDHIAALGMNGLYVTPFFPAPSSHRYDADTFEHVDPNLGGDDALASLAKACHNRGMRVIGDLTINHVGAPPRVVPGRPGRCRIGRGRVLPLPSPPRRLRGVVRRAVAAQARPARRRGPPPPARRARTR